MDIPAAYDFTMLPKGAPLSKCLGHFVKTLVEQKHRQLTAYITETDLTLQLGLVDHLIVRRFFFPHRPGTTYLYQPEKQRINDKDIFFFLVWFPSREYLEDFNYLHNQLGGMHDSDPEELKAVSRGDVVSVMRANYEKLFKPQEGEMNHKKRKKQKYEWAKELKAEQESGIASYILWADPEDFE